MKIAERQATLAELQLDEKQLNYGIKLQAFLKSLEDFKTLYESTELKPYQPPKEINNPVEVATNRHFQYLL